MWRFSPLILVLIGITSRPADAQLRPLHKKNHGVNRTLDEVKAAPGFRSASFAFHAVDMESGEVIASHNPHMALQPASTLKLLSTASALEILGPEHRFRTILELVEHSDTSGGSYPADLIIRGGGDPTPGSRFFTDTTGPSFLDEWVAALRLAGIDSLHGRIVGDASVFGPDMVPPTWSWQNMGQYYGAGPCGLSIYDNSYTLFLETGKNVGDKALVTGIEPSIPLEVECRVTSDSVSWDNTYIFGAPYSPERMISGTLPLDRKDFGVKGSMPDPALAAALLLDSALRASGITISSPASTMRILRKEGTCTPGSGRIIHEHLSPALLEIISKTNVHSVNLFAEHCLMHCGLALGAEPGTETAADSVLAFWERRGMDTEGLSMHDGSGLTQYNAISPVQLVWLLCYMQRDSEYSREFYNSMAVAGVSGTLESLCRGTPAEGQLRAKSGTISRAKAYAGYVTSVSGRNIAFSMVANGFSGSSSQARARLEQLMIALAELEK